MQCLFPFTSGPWGAYCFLYDGVGNRVEQSTPSGVESYAYPSTSNRLTTVSAGAGAPRAFIYDAAGNVITDQRGGLAYGYGHTAAGRLASVSLGGVVQGSYRYDALGRQVSRTLASGQVIHSVFDSAGHRLAEYDGATGALIRQYVWLGDLPVAVIEGGQVYLVRVDHIGRPVFATTMAGTVVWRASYHRGSARSRLKRSTGAFPGRRSPLRRRPCDHRRADRPAVSGAVVPDGERLAPELDAGLRSDDGAVHPGRPAGTRTRSS